MNTEPGRTSVQGAVSPDDGLVLAGLDGANPLAFLAALGTLEALDRHESDRMPRIAWRRGGTGWSPVLTGKDLTPEFLPDALASACIQTLALLDKLFPEEKDLGMPAGEFRAHAETSLHEVAARHAADWVAAIGCDALLDDSKSEPTIQDTALRTMSGSGHQHFLQFGRNLLQEAGASPDLIRKALFELWKYDDPVKNRTLRFDPIDDSRYALQWQNPSTDSSRPKAGSVLGANALAMMGLPMFPTAPVGSELETTGFRGRRASNTYLTWPIWRDWLERDAVRSLLQLPELQHALPPNGRLKSMGIHGVFRSQRLTVGKFRNFSPARAMVT